MGVDTALAPRGPDEEQEVAPRLPWIVGLLGVGAMLQGLIFAQQVDLDPLSRVPQVDAAVYWQWAGAIARGEWQGDTPFFSAPLYPYLVGALRSLGGSLLALYLLQVLAHLCTAGLIWFVGQRRFGPRAGLMGAGLWLLFTDPAYYTVRVLAGPLQCLLVAGLLAVCVAFEERPGVRRALGLGLLAGLTCLAWPPTLAALPVLALWVLWTARGQGALRAALALALGALAAVAPATLHNYRASGELIPISAHSGITLYHGNNPSADGTFSPLGVSGDKRVHERDAYDQVAGALGRSDIGWGEVSAYFQDKAVDWWRRNPRVALELAGRKLWLFLSARNYGDMYMPRLERDDGVASRLWLAPLPLAWAALPALLAAIGLTLRDPRKQLPALALFAVPVLVCIVFFYTPRYRLPAGPLIALFGGYALTHGWCWRARPWSTGALALAWLVALSGGMLNGALSLDSAAQHRAEYELRMGRALVELGAPDLARERFARAAELGHPAAALETARLLALEDPLGALDDLRALAEGRPTDGAAQSAYATALALAGETDSALARFERAVALDASDVRAELGLGGCLVQLGRAEEALPHFARVLDLDSRTPDAHFNLGQALTVLDREQDAARAFERELELDPGHEHARGALVALHQRAGRHVEAADNAREMLARQADHPGALMVLSWLLSTSPDDDVRDGPESLRLARKLVEGTGGTDPFALETLAAALAETGDFSGALDTQRQALASMRTMVLGANEMALAEERLARYGGGEPWRDRP